MNGNQQKKIPLSEIRGFFAEYWELMKAYQDVPTDTEGWSELIEESSALLDKYKTKDFSPFAEKVVLAMIEYMEGVYRNDKIGGNE